MVRVQTENSEEAGDFSATLCPWSPQYVWLPPSEAELPCNPEQLQTFLSDESLLMGDVTNLLLTPRPRPDSPGQVLTLNNNKPYEPKDPEDRFLYRSAEHLLQVRSLGCRIIPEREVVIQSIVSGFTARVLVYGKTYIEKKLPLAPFHLDPFLYEMKALYKLRGCEGIGYISFKDCTPCRTYHVLEIRGSTRKSPCLSVQRDTFQDDVGQPQPSCLGLQCWKAAAEAGERQRALATAEVI